MSICYNSGDSKTPLTTACSGKKRKRRSAEYLDDFTNIVDPSQVQRLVSWDKKCPSKA